MTEKSKRNLAAAGIGTGTGVGVGAGTYLGVKNKLSRRAKAGAKASHSKYKKTLDEINRDKKKLADFEDVLSTKSKGKARFQGFERVHKGIDDISRFETKAYGKYQKSKSMYGKHLLKANKKSLLAAALIGTGVGVGTGFISKAVMNRKKKAKV